MSEANSLSSYFQGYLIWSFILGIFFIPIAMAITTTDTVQDMTDWKHGYGMILGAVFGILFTLIVAFILERKSR